MVLNVPAASANPLASKIVSVLKVPAAAWTSAVLTPAGWTAAAWTPAPKRPGGTGASTVRCRRIATELKGSSPVVKYALGGWSLIPLFEAYTGSPYSLYDGKLAGQADQEWFDARWAEALTALVALPARLAALRQPGTEESGSGWAAP